MRRAGFVAGLGALTAALGLAYVQFVVKAPSERFRWGPPEAPLQLLEPRWLGVLLLAPALLWIARASLADLPWQQKALSWLVRVLFLLVVGLGLAQAVRTESSDRICTAVLLDVSDSVSDRALEAGRGHVERIVAARRADDQVRLITVARRAVEVDLEPEGDAARLEVPPLTGLRPAVAGDGAETDLKGGLEHAYGALGTGCLRRVVVLSDGVETRGASVPEAARARELGIVVHSVPLREAPPADVAVTAVEVPPKVTLGEPFEVVARVRATRPGRAVLRLYQGEVLNELDGVKTLELAAGEERVSFRSVARVGGEVTYTLQVEPSTDDAFSDNNRAAVTVDVPGRPQVLYVEGRPSSASYLASALTAQQLDVDVRAPGAFPGSLGELERYAFVIVSDVSREALGRNAEALIERYVRDVGGGFMMAGGPSGFGLGGWQGSGLERLLPVRMDAEKHREMPGVAMSLVIDRSGSMTGLPMEMAKQACSATVGVLQPDDLIEVIAFDSSPTRYVKLQPARYRSRIQNDILRIQPSGGTELFKSLDMAYQDIATVEARKKHVILLTDGNANSDGLYDVASAMLSERITVTTVGLGSGVNEELLRMIADAGGGRFHAVQDPNHLPRVFARETELISKEAAVDDWFPVQRAANAAFLDGVAIGSAPLLRGYVATQLKPSPAQLILASDRGEPILARWRVGLGWALAWTSDVKNGWALDWLRWPQFGRFWAQLIREHMRGERRRELPMSVRVDDGEIVAEVQSLTDDERFDSSLESTLSVRAGAARGAGRSAASERRAFELVAPGRYEARLRAPGFGTFLLEATHRRRDPEGRLQAVGVSYGHAALPYPKEYAALEPDLARMQALALAGGGAVDPPPPTVFDPAGEKVQRRVPQQGRFILVALGLFLVDLLLRRVRLFDRNFRAGRARVRA